MSNGLLNGKKMTSKQQYFGGIEAGGTKFVCAVGNETGEILTEARFPTTTPDETITRCLNFFREQLKITPLSAIGVGSFGPVDLNPTSPTYGYITSTPKPGWSQKDILGRFRTELNLPVGFDTDTNAAALGEQRWGAARGLDDFLYLTIGTGIGGGGLSRGQLIHGLVHPEMGHIPLPHDRVRDPFEGFCPFHKDCFEGLASGPAVAARWKCDPATLPGDHPAWQLEAHYIALALAIFVCTLSPQRIIMGGGIMEQTHLFPIIRQEILKILNGYVRSDVILNQIDSYVVAPGLKNHSGVTGAFALAMDAVH